MITCYRCGCERCVKNGFMQDQQRYKCKECGYNFIDKPRRGHSQATLALAVWLYHCGVSQRRIALLFGVSPPAVRKWIKNYALNNAPKPVPTGQGAMIVKLCELRRILQTRPARSGYGTLWVVLEDKSLTGDTAVLVGPR
jgi:hypothetical protein